MTIEERLDVIENDIKELKEAFQTLSTAAPATASNESLLKSLQEQVAALTTAQQNCRTQCDQLKAQVGSNSERISNCETADSLLTEKIQATDQLPQQLQDLKAEVTAKLDSLEASTKQIPQIELQDKQLKITTIQE